MINIVWHPSKNIVSFVTSEGEVFIHPDFISSDHVPLLETGKQSAPFARKPLAETSGNARKLPADGGKEGSKPQGRRAGTPDSLDDILGPEFDDNEFVSDDDGAGYAEGINGYGKRGSGHLDDLPQPDNKRRTTYQAWQPRLHKSFQPGSTPILGDRRYLCMLPSPFSEIPLMI